mgnify:CR=1 FL=1
MNLRISTFNLFQFCSPPYSYYTKKEKFSPIQWQSKVNWIEETINHINSDIIAFQEVFTQEEIKELLIKNGYKYFASVDEAILEKNIFQTCVVFLASKYPINKIQTIQTNDDIVQMLDLEDEFVFSRKPIKAYIQVEKKELVTYVFHLKSNRLNEFEYKFLKETFINEKIEKSLRSFTFKNANALKQRLCEVIHLSEDISKTLKTNENIIALGDLNDKEFCLSIDLLTNKSLIEQILKTMNLNSINISENRSQLFDSFYLDKSYKKRPSTSYFRTVGNVIDYIFISKKLKSSFSNYDIYDLHLKDNKNGSLIQSDHAIISTDFQF